MQKESNKPNFEKTYRFSLELLFGLIAFLKFTKFYLEVRFEEFAIVYAFITLAIISGSYIIVKSFSKRSATIFATIFYILCSIVLFIDCVYFSYMNKFTSIANLKIVKFMEAVGDSISKVHPEKYLWILADIPIIIICEVFSKKIIKKLNDKINIKEKFLTCAKIIINSLIIIAILMYSFVVDFRFNYIKSENIVYHTRDIIDNYFYINKNVEYGKYFGVKEVVQDENYGIAQGRNVIVIQLEAVQNFVINKTYNGEEITPFLNKLINNDTFYFKNHFYQVGGGNTSDAEFTINNSLLSTITDPAYIKYEDNTYYGLPHILKDNGYKEANAFHAYKEDYWNRNNAYQNQGFDNYYSEEDYTIDEVIGLGLSDKSFLTQVAKKIKNTPEPNYSFIITLSSHHPFIIDQSLSRLTLKEEHQNTLYGDYLNSINYLDSALENFFNELKKNNLYKDSIFVIYGDHFGIANYNTQDAMYISDLIGYEYSVKDMMNVPLFIHIPNMNKSETIEKVSGHVDVLPTLLHLLGIENKKSIMMGNDLFSIEDNIVYEMMHVGEGSFVTNDAFYYSSVSKIDVFNKAYDINTGEEKRITKEMLKNSSKAIEYLKNVKALLMDNQILYTK